MTADALRGAIARTGKRTEGREAAARRYLTLAAAAEVARHRAVSARLWESDALADLAAVLCDDLTAPPSTSTCAGSAPARKRPSTPR